MISKAKAVPRSAPALDSVIVESLGLAPRSQGSVRLRIRLILAAFLAAAAYLLLAAASSVPPAAAAVDPCPNAEFRDGPAAHLPDCRAYEKVSPLDKGGGEVPPRLGLAAPVPRQASLDGNAVTYASSGAFAGTENALPIASYLSTRGPGGWATDGLGWTMNPSGQPAVTFAFRVGYRAFSPDLSLGALSNVAPNGPELAPGAPAGYPNLYLRDLGTSSYTLLTTVAPPNYPPQHSSNSYVPVYQGASADFSHVLFSAPDALTPDAQVPCSACRNLYEWTGGQLRLVNVLPGGTSTNDAGAGGHSFFTPFAGEQEVGSGLLTNAISADGSKIYWTDKKWDPSNIYVRVDGATTVPVGNGTFWAASSDGERAIYITGNQNGGGDLHLFDLDTGTSTNLTPGGQMEGIVGTSDDLSYIYFVAAGALAPGATAGEANLYLWHAGAITLVATLPGGPTGEADVGSSEQSIDAIKATGRNSYVTPDGRHLAFTSRGSLTGYDNTLSGGQPYQNACRGTPARCSQVYIYDADSGTVACASCNPSGAQPQGPSMVAPWQTQFHAPRSITDDGPHVFFHSWDALVPGDTNGQQDVYQWKPDGAGGCELAGGCADLISGGTGGTTSPTGGDPIQNQTLNTFVDASPDGRDVFFTTRQPLTGDDADPSGDLYDARVDGGFPAPTTPTPCSGDACQGNPTPAPSSPGSGSATFTGPGNQGRDRGGPAKKGAKKKKGCKRIKKKAKRKQCRAKKKCKRIDDKGKRKQCLRRHRKLSHRSAK